MQKVNQIQFPEFQGISCNMMPFIQGDSSSLPETLQSYSSIIDSNYLEKGEIGFLTIDEKYVKANTSQRGYNSLALDRNVHIEVGRLPVGNRWGSGHGNGWGGNSNTLLEDLTQVLIANSIDDTCRIWDNLELGYTSDGDLSHVIDNYPEHTGLLMKAGELFKISIFNPHECIVQKKNGPRQFFRIVGKGVTGRESYFTRNPKMKI